ncbi:MAG: hypothetical protein ACWGO1_01705 [Anaerolineales bacterium]
MRLFKWGQKKNNEDLSRLESVLESALKPVRPSQDYVRRLRYQIVSQYEPIREEVKAHRQRTVLLVGASLVGGLLTLVMGIRIVMTLVAGVAMLLQWKRSPSPEPMVVARQIR